MYKGMKGVRQRRCVEMGMTAMEGGHGLSTKAPMLYLDFEDQVPPRNCREEEDESSVYSHSFEHLITSYL